MQNWSALCCWGVSVSPAVGVSSVSSAVGVSVFPQLLGCQCFLRCWGVGVSVFHQLLGVSDSSAVGCQ